MSLLTKLAEVPTRPVEPCLYGRIRSSLTEEEQQALDSALEKIKADKGTNSNRIYTTKWLVDALRSEGHMISEATILRHKNGSCNCVID